MQIEEECVQLCTDSMRDLPSLSQQGKFPLSGLSSSDALPQDLFPYRHLLVSFQVSFTSLGLSDSGLVYDFKVTGGTSLFCFLFCLFKN